MHKVNNDGLSCAALAAISDFRKTALLQYARDVEMNQRRRLFDNVETEMERTIAIKKLGRLLGKNLGYRVDPKAPDQEERDAARAELQAVAAERDAIKAKRDGRHRAILEADAEYQSLQAAYSEARERAEKLLSMTHHYRFTVGTTNGMFFLVKAQGDSWREVIEKIEAEKQAA